MTVITDVRSAVADLLGIDRDELEVLEDNRPDSGCRLVLSDDQARRLVTLARVGRSWCEETSH
jgi:hypothetical protein